MNKQTKKLIRGIALVVFLAILSFSPAHAVSKKTDRIYLKNGDRITGEIKELSQGLVRLKTDAIDTIYIKWEDINYVQSDKWLSVELTDGTRFFGQAAVPDEESGLMQIKTQRGPIEIAYNKVVRMEQIKVDESFWERLDNSLKIGFNYTKASDVSNFNINASTSYKTQEYLASLSFDSTLTGNSSGDDTQRGDLTAAYQRFKGNRWFWFGSASAQTNEELGINLRLIGSGGMGRFVMQTARTEWWLAGGLAANFERTVEDELNNNENEASWEGLIQTEWNFFKLHSPKSRWKVKAQLFPGISDTDRYRGNLDLTFSQEFFADLFWDMSFYYSYDSKPPVTASAKDDYGINTSIGYTF